MPTYVSSDVNAGDTVLATQMNQVRADAQEPTTDSARIYASTGSAVTITNGTPTPIEFDLEAHDTDTFWTSAVGGSPIPNKARITRTATDDALYQLDLQVNMPDVHTTLDDITIKLYKNQGGSDTLLKTHTHKFNESVSSGKVWVSARDMFGDNTGGTLSYNSGLGTYNLANTRSVIIYNGGLVAEAIPYPDTNNVNHAFFTVRLPYYDANNSASDNTFKIHWVGGSTRNALSGYDVYWELTSFDMSDDKGIEASTWTNATGASFDTNNTNTNFYLNVDPINIPIAGGSNPLTFALRRYSSSGDDTMNANANVLGVEIDYKPAIAHKHDETIHVRHLVNETGNTADWYYYYTITATNTDPLITTTDIGATTYAPYDLSILQLYTGGV